MDARETGMDKMERNCILFCPLTMATPAVKKNRSHTMLNITAYKSPSAPSSSSIRGKPRKAVLANTAISTNMDRPFSLSGRNRLRSRVTTKAQR